MTVALTEVSNQEHYWVVLEFDPHRLTRSLSDLDGYERLIHYGTVDGMFQTLLDAFEKPTERVTLEEMRRGYAGVQPLATQMRRKLRRSPRMIHYVELNIMGHFPLVPKRRKHHFRSLYTRTAFKRLVLPAVEIRERIRALSGVGNNVDENSKTHFGADALARVKLRVRSA